MDVAAIMTRDVVTAPPTETVRAAITLLEDEDIRHLPIVDGGRLVGMVSDRDLREYRAPLAVEGNEGAAALLDTPLSQVMREDPLTMAPTESLRQAIDVMLEYGVGAIPIVEDDELLGIVSYVDILRTLRASM